MNKLLLLFCCFLLLSVSAPVAAKSGDQVLGPDELQAIFVDILQPDIPSRIEDISITDFSSSPKQVILGPGKISWHAEQRASGQLSPGKKFIKVIVKLNGNESAGIKMYGTVHFFNTVIITTASLARHKIISEDDLATDFREVSFLADNFIERPELAVGKELKRSLGNGAVIYRNFLKSPALVKRGDKVTILAAGHGIKVTTPGEVKNTAGLGEMVRVKNLMSRQLIHARVVGKGVVRVEL